MQGIHRLGAGGLRLLAGLRRLPALRSGHNTVRLQQWADDQAHNRQSDHHRVDAVRASAAPHDHRAEREQRRQQRLRAHL